MMAGTPIPAVVFEELDSTNAEARRRADAGERGPIWLMARRQSAGRGRRGRAWDGGQGNLTATLLMTLDKPPLEAAQLAFVAALAAGRTIAPSQRGGASDASHMATTLASIGSFATTPSGGASNHITLMMRR